MTTVQQYQLYQGLPKKVKKKDSRGFTPKVRLHMNIVLTDLKHKWGLRGIISCNFIALTGYLFTLKSISTKISDSPLVKYLTNNDIDGYIFTL